MGTRFRWGISPFGGALIGAGATGGGGGLDLRFGVQLSRRFGIVVQPVSFGGAATTPVGTSARSAVGILVGGGVGGVLDVTFADHYFVAAGVEGSVVTARNTLTPITTPSSTVPVFGIPARVGVRLGTPHPDKRRAFVLALDVRTLVVDGGPFVMPSFAIGYDSY